MENLTSRLPKGYAKIEKQDFKCLVYIDFRGILTYTELSSRGYNTPQSPLIPSIWFELPEAREPQKAEYIMPQFEARKTGRVVTKWKTPDVTRGYSGPEEVEECELVKIGERFNRESYALDIEAYEEKKKALECATRLHVVDRKVFTGNALVGVLTNDESAAWELNCKYGVRHVDSSVLSELL